MMQWTNFFRSLSGAQQFIRYKSSISKTKLLLILDGWGEGDNKWYNAIHAANTPNWDEICSQNPKTLIQASGSYVGLPPSQPGNSEAGHIHIGAGAIVNQDFTMINKAIADGSFQKNAVFLNTIKKLQESGKYLHIFGLLSPGGTHSHQDHLFAFLEVCYAMRFTNVYLHLAIDGNDPKQNDAKDSLNILYQHLASKQINGRPVAKIASMIGRQYALNRNQEWNKTEYAYDLLTKINIKISANSPLKALESWYNRGVGGAKLAPTRFHQDGYVKNGDSFFVFNYRSDRVLQIVRALTQDTFSYFKRHRQVKFSEFIGMMPYADDVPSISAFSSNKPKTTLGAIVANYGKSQLRLAETEKAAHVGRFFNGDGGREVIHANEQRMIIQSPIVSSYECKPEMAAYEVTSELVHAILQERYDLIVANLANADILGHTGNLHATVQAIDALDRCLGRILQALKQTDTEAIITADHGNADIMFNEAKQKKHLGHTSAPVPCVYVGPLRREFHNDAGGSLIDIAPTLLEMLDLPKPQAMTGKSLFKSKRTFFHDKLDTQNEDSANKFVLR